MAWINESLEKARIADETEELRKATVIDPLKKSLVDGQIEIFHTQTEGLKQSLLTLLAKAKTEKLWVDDRGMERFHSSVNFNDGINNKFLTERANLGLENYNRAPIGQNIYSYKFKITEPIRKKKLYIFLTLNVVCSTYQPMIYIEGQHYQSEEVEGVIRNWLFQIYKGHTKTIHPR